MNIRKNTNGQRNLRDLRAALTQRDPPASVTRQGGQWITRVLMNGCWIEQPSDPYADERETIERVLQLPRDY
jgi:hypothetical protein